MQPLHKYVLVDKLMHYFINNWSNYNETDLKPLQRSELCYWYKSDCKSVMACVSLFILSSIAFLEVWFSDNNSLISSSTSAICK